MRKVFALLVLATLMISSMSVEVSQSQIDVVEQLLAQLKGTTQAELKEVNEDYHNAKALKEEIIASLSDALGRQRGECNDRDRDVADRTRDIEVTQNYIFWLNERLVANTARKERLEKNRCAQNGNYLDGLRNQKISLRLIIFLRTALENASEFSFAQKQEMGKYVARFLAMYKNAKKHELIQFAKDVEHTFNAKIDLVSDEVPPVSFAQQNVNGTRLELIEILNQLERDIRAAIASGQEQEVNVGIRLADYFGQIALEQNYMNKEVAQELNNLQSLRNQLTSAQSASTNCKARLDQMALTVQTTQNDLQSQTNLYNSQVRRLQEELALFQDVYRIYASKVATQDDRFKKRVDDYVDNQQFDSSSGFTNRNTFGNLQGSMSDVVRQQAEREAQVA